MNKIKELWNRFLIWLGFRPDPNLSIIGSFAQEEQEKEEAEVLATKPVLITPDLTFEGNPGLCVPPPLRRKSVSKGDYEDDVEDLIEDAVVTVAVINASNDYRYTGDGEDSRIFPQEEAKAEWGGFGGGGDFDGGGAGGSWTEDNTTSASFESASGELSATIENYS